MGNKQSVAATQLLQQLGEQALKYHTAHNNRNISEKNVEDAKDRKEDALPISQPTEGRKVKGVLGARGVKLGHH